MHKLLNAVYDLHAAANMFSRILLKIKFKLNIDFFLFIRGKLIY